MKITNLLFTAVLVSLLFSCNKDKDNDLEPLKNSHRIKLVFSGNDGDYELRKSVFLYEGEKLIKKTQYEKDESGNWLEEYKTEITYSGDNATVTWYDKESGSWEIDDKSKFVIQNGLMIEELNYAFEFGAWVENGKWTYQYSGSNISAWQEYYSYDGHGIWVQNGKGEYIYQSGKLIEYKGYELDEPDNLYQDDKVTFSYTSDNLTGLIDYYLGESDNWEKDYKAEFLYSGDKVSEIENFYWDSESNQWESEPEYSESYTYNSNGYLIEKLNEDDYKTTFEYEEGNGNAKIFYYYPEESVYGVPTLKSTSLNNERKYIPYYLRLINI